MRCPKCKSEIGYQRICPYCATDVKLPIPDKQTKSDGVPQGRTYRFLRNMETRLKKLDDKMNLLLVLQVGTFLLAILTMLATVLK